MRPRTQTLSTSSEVWPATLTPWSMRSPLPTKPDAKDCVRRVLPLVSSTQPPGLRTTSATGESTTSTAGEIAMLPLAVSSSGVRSRPAAERLETVTQPLCGESVRSPDRVSMSGVRTLATRSCRSDGVDRECAGEAAQQRRLPARHVIGRGAQARRGGAHVHHHIPVAAGDAVVAADDAVRARLQIGVQACRQVGQARACLVQPGPRQQS